MGWTRQQAIDYGVEASEVERYVVLPGQACAYMIGQLKIVELRERAREALGERFSIREFHDDRAAPRCRPAQYPEREVCCAVTMAERTKSELNLARARSSLFVRLMHAAAS